jgi:hypothetical protein
MRISEASKAQRRVASGLVFQSCREGLRRRRLLVVLDRPDTRHHVGAPCVEPATR